MATKKIKKKKKKENTTKKKKIERLKQFTKNS